MLVRPVIVCLVLAALLSPLSASADPAVVTSVTAPGDTVQAFGYDWSLAVQKDADFMTNTSILGTKKGVEAYRLPLGMVSGSLVSAELDHNPKNGAELVFVPRPEGSGAYVQGILWMTEAGTLQELGFNGTGGVSIEDADGDGVAEIHTRIYMGWGSTASAARPLWVLSIRDGGLEDVTGQHPKLLQADVDAHREELEALLKTPNCADEQSTRLADLATYGAYAALRTQSRAEAMRIWGANNPCVTGFDGIAGIERSLAGELKNLKSPGR